MRSPAKLRTMIGRPVAAAKPRYLPHHHITHQSIMLIKGEIKTNLDLFSPALFLTFASLVYKMDLIGKTDSTNGSNRAYVAISDQYGRKTGKIINIWGEKKIQSFLEARLERVSRDPVNLFVYPSWPACPIDIPDLEWPQPYPGRRRNFWALYSYPLSLGRDALTR